MIEEIFRMRPKLITIIINAVVTAGNMMEIIGIDQSWI